MTVYDYREITLKDDLCLEISRDTDIENPRENDCNAATFYCLKSPRRKIGDIIDSAYYLNETKRTLAKTGEYAILPIYIYEHSSIALCTVPFSDGILLRRYLKTTNYNKEYINMELKLSSNFSGKLVSVVVPIEKVIEVFWPKDEKPPISLTVSTVLGADSANAEFSLGEETKESYPGIWLTTDNVKSHRHCSWFRLELPNDTNDIVMGHLYAGDDDMETDQPLAIIADGIRADGDESKRILWVDEDVTCVKSMNDDYLNRQKAITEKQLSDLSSGIFLQNFDYIVYGKRLASKSENTVEFVKNTIVSHNKQELEVVASGMEAMGLSVETGYYDPDDESSVDVPKQLIGFHYIVLKEKV